MSKAIEKAILRIAYNLASLSGEGKEEYKHGFHVIARALWWYHPGESETDEYVAALVNGSRELAAVRQIYDEEDFCKCFLSIMQDDCDLIRAIGAVTARVAFAIWISLCLMDNEISDLEGRILFMLMNRLNSRDCFGMKPASKWCASIPTTDWLFSPILDFISRIMRGRLDWERYKNAERDGGSLPNAEFISENFFGEVVDGLGKIVEIKIQEGKAKKAPLRKSLMQAYAFAHTELDILVGRGYAL